MIWLIGGGIAGFAFALVWGMCRAGARADEIAQQHVPESRTERKKVTQ